MKAFVTALILAAGLTSVGAFTPASAAVYGPPANATPQAEAEAIVDPSLAFIAVDASGTVTVPWTSGAKDYPVSNAYIASCSGSVVDPSGVVLTAGHCADPQNTELRTFVIDHVYQQLEANGSLSSSYAQSSAEQNWSVSATLGLSFQVYSLATTTRVGDATPMTGSTITGSDRPLGQGDVALIQVSPPGLLPALVPAASTPIDGTNLVAAGFPGAVTSTVDIGSLEPTLTPGQVTSLQAFDGNPFVGVSATETPGMSGGPTISIPDGSIYGTTSWGPAGENTQQLNFITGTRTVQSVLRQFDVSPTLDKADLAWRKGLTDYFAGKYREAIPQFNTVLNAMPNDIWAKQYLGLAQQSVSQEPAAPVHHSSSSGMFVFIGVGVGVVVVILAGIGGYFLFRRRRGTGGTTGEASTS